MAESKMEPRSEREAVEVYVDIVARGKGVEKGGRWIGVRSMGRMA